MLNIHSRIKKITTRVQKEDREFAKIKLIDFIEACRVIHDMGIISQNPKPEKTKNIISLTYPETPYTLGEVEMWVDTDINEVVYFSIEGGE